MANTVLYVITKKLKTKSSSTLTGRNVRLSYLLICSCLWVMLLYAKLLTMLWLLQLSKRRLMLLQFISIKYSRGFWYSMLQTYFSSNLYSRGLNWSMSATCCTKTVQQSTACCIESQWFVSLSWVIATIPRLPAMFVNIGVCLQVGVSHWPMRNGVISAWHYREANQLCRYMS